MVFTGSFLYSCLSDFHNTTINIDYSAPFYSLVPSISSFALSPSILNAQTLTFCMAWQCTFCQFSTTTCTFKHNESIWCENMLAFPPSLSPAVFVKETVCGISQQVCLTFFCLCSLCFFPLSSSHTRSHQKDRWSWPGYVSPSWHLCHLANAYRPITKDKLLWCISFVHFIEFFVLLYN